MNKIKKTICLLLVPVFLSMCACGEQTGNTAQNNTPEETIKYNTPAGMVKKSETVYVNLDTYGNAVQTIVSDWLHTDKAEVYVDDVTNLSEIENIKDDTKPDVNGSNLRWYMKTTDLYYQGQSQAKLPVEFELSYALNGIPTISFRESDPYGFGFDYREIWHTEKDRYNKLIPEYMEPSAVINAVVAYGLANLDHLLSREGLYSN